MATRPVVPRATGEGSIGTAAKHWGAGYFDTLPNWQEYLVESTGYGIVSGCEPSISGLTVTVGAGVVHLADGTRKEVSSTNVTLDAADSTNPRIDLVYITSAGEVAKITGTAAASPSAPALPSGGISVCTVSVAANASAGTVTDTREMLARWYNAGVVNVKDYGAVGDGVTDDTAAIQAAIDNAAANNGLVFFGKNTYCISSTLFIPTNISLIGNKSTIIIKCNDYAFGLNTKDNSTTFSSWHLPASTICDFEIVSGNGFNAAKGIKLGDNHRIVNVVFSGLNKSISQCSGTYIDNKFLDTIYVHNSQAGNSDFDIELEKGDGLFINDVVEAKTRISMCNGGILTNFTNGTVYIVNSKGVSFKSSHYEKSNDTVFVKIEGSSVSITDMFAFKLPDKNIMYIGGSRGANVSVTNVNIIILNNVTYGDSSDIVIDGDKDNVTFKNVYRFTLKQGGGVYGLSTSITINNNTINPLVCSQGFMFINGSIEYLVNYVPPVRDRNATLYLRNEEHSKATFTNVTKYYAAISMIDNVREIDMPSIHRYNITVKSIECRVGYANEISCSRPFCGWWRIYRGNSDTSFTEYVDIPFTGQGYIEGSLYDLGDSINQLYQWVQLPTPITLATRRDGDFNPMSDYICNADGTIEATVLLTPDYTVGSWTKGDIVKRYLSDSINIDYCISGGSSSTWKRHTIS